MENKDKIIEEKLLEATNLLKHSLETMEMPKALQETIPKFLLQQIASQHKPTFKMQNWVQELSLNQWRTWSGLGFCSVMFFLILMMQNEMAINPHVNKNEQIANIKNEPEKVPFVILNEAEFLAQQANLKVISSQVSNRILVATGIPINPQNLAGYSNAELLVGNDDELIAVRFVAE